jgi:nitrous oxidase accessory protein
MNRVRVGVTWVAVAVGATLLLAAGPAGALVSTGSRTAVATPHGCTRSHAPGGTGGAAQRSAGHGDMAGMPGMGDGTADHSVRELTDRLARTPAGGTLTVRSGVYRGALVIDRPVTLIGIGHPVLRGDGTGTVLTIRAPQTTIRGLMIEGSGPGPVDNPAGIRVQADHVVVQDTHIRDSYTGIWVEGVSDAHILGNVIEGRRSVAAAGETPASATDMAAMPMKDSGHDAARAGRGDGVSLFNAIRPVVSGNAISDVRDGVYLEYGRGTRIDCNTVVGGRYAIHSMYGKAMTVAGNHFTNNQSGPILMYGGPVTLEGNVIREEQSAATGFGVLLLDVGGVRLLRNVIVSNRVGLQIEGPLDDPRATSVELNTIALNQVGVGLYPTANAHLSQNSFVENTVQVLGLGPDGAGSHSRWSHNGIGNYWSDYRGYERSGSGVGEIPHVEGAAAGRLLASDPSLLALASSPAFILLRAVEQRTAGQHPVSSDPFPIVDARSPSLPSTAVHPSLRTGLVGGIALAVCSLALVRCTRRRTFQLRRVKP